MEHTHAHTHTPTRTHKHTHTSIHTTNHLRMHQVDDKHDDNVGTRLRLELCVPADDDGAAGSPVYVCLCMCLSVCASLCLAGFYGNAKYVKDAADLTAERSWNGCQQRSIIAPDKIYRYKSKTLVYSQDPPSSTSLPRLPAPAREH